MEFDLVIFDLDGVLIDSEMLSCGTLVDVMAGHGITISLETVFAEFLGRSFAAVERYFLRETGAAMPAAFRAELRETLFERFRRELAPMAGATDLLRRMRLPFCLASSSDAERVALSLDVAGLAGFFGERVFNAAMVAHGKPAPDLFLHAARMMGAAPGRALVIEDSVNGVLAGKAAGMTVWGFVGGSHHRGRDAGEILLRAGADRIIASFDPIELPLLQEEIG